MIELTQKQLFEFDDDELYAELGNRILGEGASFGPEDFGRYRRFATKWLDQHLAEIKDAVCGHPAVEYLQFSENSNMLLEAATVADCLAAVYGRPTATVAAVIVVRRGLNTFCGIP
jgi:hypothetical protein